MDKIFKRLYTADVTTTGGRGGRAVSSDGLIDLALARPGQGTATNPEQLLAAGWGACFQSAMAVASKGTGIRTEDSKVRVLITLGTTDSDRYAVSSEILVHVPDVDLTRVQELVERTHDICPYSRATAGNIQSSASAVDVGAL